MDPSDGIGLTQTIISRSNSERTCVPLSCLYQMGTFCTQLLIPFHLKHLSMYFFYYSFPALHLIEMKLFLRFNETLSFMTRKSRNYFIVGNYFIDFFFKNLIEKKFKK